MWICTLSTFKLVHPHHSGKLEQACAHLGLSWDVMRAHTADYDALMCAKLFLKLESMY